MPSSIPERLSALDASFLAIESPLAPMHVGWVASFDPPADGPVTAEELIAHIAVAHGGRAPLPPEAGRRAARRPRPRVGRRPRLRSRAPPARGRPATSTPGRRGAVDAARPRPPAVGDVGLGRPADDHRQGPPLHGRRPRRGRARQPAARRRPGRDGPRRRRMGPVARAQSRPAPRPRDRRPHRRDRGTAGHAAAAGGQRASVLQRRRAWPPTRCCRRRRPRR